MKIIICDDQAVIREGLELLLNLENDIQVLGLAQEGMEAIELVDKLHPDLVLMDLKMSGVNGVEATRQIKKLVPDTKVLVLTTYDDDEWIFDAIRAGASGYLLKDTPREKLVEAIRGTVEGRTFLDPTIAGKVMNQAASHEVHPPTLLTSKLTEREVEILRLLAKGLNNADIAAKLFLSEGTVRNHVSSILEKLSVSDRTQAAVIAIQHGFG
jgi:DNA-binding NarL/FixJ family response regulator